MFKKLPSSTRVIFASVMLFVAFSSSAFAHQCYIANKPDGAGAITSEEQMWVNKGGKDVMQGAFVNPSLWGLEGYQDIFIRGYFDTAAQKGSTTNGVQEYVIPE
ncbi:hypothetical protein [Paenibacillus sp. Soil787]|uniref:hypothetical protein n=1 Tax=Paenibacillus sp. Soil787 TaxID=1736411 RepID=UPI000703290B|nr:hypothetical protein [Paenibacillus sp. Soil787]KRF13603.1 hypothetical protein ASG93_13885 [Paenibacillus sp. Soil787]